MNTDALAQNHRWLPLPAESRVVDRSAIAWTAALVLSVGALLATLQSVIWPVLLAPIWLLVAFLLPRCTPQAARAVAAVAFGYALTMLSVVVVCVRGPAVMTGQAHPAFGEHPVLWTAGLPWPGVEGTDHGLGCDRIPFTMGVDALLVDFAFWALLVAFAARRLPAKRLAALCAPACLAAAACGLLGACRLVALFD